MSIQYLGGFSFVKLWELFKESIITEKEIEMKEQDKRPENYKSCPDCNGIGWTDPFTNCDTCSHTGYVRKSYQEYVDSLPE